MRRRVEAPEEKTVRQINIEAFVDCVRAHYGGIGPTQGDLEASIQAAWKMGQAQFDLYTLRDGEAAARRELGK